MPMRMATSGGRPCPPPFDGRSIRLVDAAAPSRSQLKARARAMPFAAHAAAQPVVVEQARDRAARCRRVARDRPAGPASPSTSGSEPRLAATTGTPSVIASSTGMPKPSSNDGCTSSRAPSYSAWRSVRVDVADVADAPAQRRPRRSGRATAARPSVALPASTSSGTTRSLRRDAMQPLVRVEQAADVLARLQRAEEQHVAVVRRGRARGVQSGAPGGQIGDPIARHAELALDLAGGEPRRHEDRVGAVRVSARERRVVAADLGARPLGMREKVQIVNRDHLRGRRERAAAADAASGRRRRRGPSSISAGGQPSRCHAKFSSANRDAAIDDRRARQIGRRRRADPSRSSRTASASSARVGRGSGARGQQRLRRADGCTRRRRCARAAPAGNRSGRALV